MSDDVHKGKLETRAIHARITLTWYEDGELEASWPTGENAEIVTRYLLSKAEDYYNQHCRQQQFMQNVQQGASGVKIVDATTLRSLDGKKNHG